MASQVASDWLKAIKAGGELFSSKSCLKFPWKFSPKIGLHTSCRVSHSCFSSFFYFKQNFSLFISEFLLVFYFNNLLFIIITFPFLTSCWLHSKSQILSHFWKYLGLTQAMFWCFLLMISDILDLIKVMFWWFFWWILMNYYDSFSYWFLSLSVKFWFHWLFLESFSCVVTCF